MTRIAVSGIPSHWHRTIIGSNNFATKYRESTLEVSSKRNLYHEARGILNTGNYFIGEGVRAALGHADIQGFPRDWLTGEDANQWVDYINQNFDVFIFGVANTFHPQFKTVSKAKLFERLNIPIIMLSAGIQSKKHFGESYPESFRPLMKVLAEKEIFIFTRGNYTADFLKNHGVKFAEAVGCPSNYYRPQNVRLALRKIKSIDPESDFLINHSGYLGSVEETIEDINLFGGSKDAIYSLQDEFLWFKYEIVGEEDSKAYDDASGQIVGQTHFPGKEKLNRKLREYIFFNTDQWRSIVSTVDFSMGRRFHGNIAAAQAGIPFFIISRDDRMDEMLENSGYLSISNRDWCHCKDKMALLKQLIDEFDAEEAINTYNRNLNRFRSLLKKAIQK